MHTRILDPGKFMDRKVPSFRLKTVLSHGVLLGGSFDLKQVIVVRKSPETGEDWKVVFNAEGPSDIDDLHLRNGDAIYLQ